jgi:hypothetical protein
VGRELHTAVISVALILGNGAVAQQSQSVPALIIVPVSLMATGQQGGPFWPPSFQFRLAATTGTVDYSIELPVWLTGPNKGKVDTEGALVTLTINSAAQNLSPGTHTPVIKFKNTTNGRGSVSKAIGLVVRSTPMTGADSNIGGYLLDSDRTKGFLLTKPKGERLLAR